MGDAWAAFARDLVTTGDVNDVYDEVGEFAGVVGCEVVAAGFDEQEVGVELLVEVGEGEEVDRDVFADGGVRTASCLDGYDALTVEPAVSILLVDRGVEAGLRGESIVLGQELGVFSREDVVGYCSYGEAGSQVFAEGQHKGCLAGADRSDVVSIPRGLYAGGREARLTLQCQP